MEALSFCDPRFHDTTKTELPFLLKQCICENLGMEQGGLVVESAQILMPLTEVTPFIARKELTPGGARFFYHYLLFRALMVSFFASYMWQDRKLKDPVYLGILKSRPMVRLIRAGKAIHFLREEDLPLSQRLYLKMHMFMRQWAIFDPKNEKAWYRYYPNFTSYITDRMEDEHFEDRINGLLDGTGISSSRRPQPSSIHPAAPCTSPTASASGSRKISLPPSGRSTQRIPC